MDDRFSDKDAALLSEFVDANEIGLALEWMADQLGVRGQPLSTDERADMLALADRMQMGDRVPQALALCPMR